MLLIPSFILQIELINPNSLIRSPLAFHAFILVSISRAAGAAGSNLWRL